MNYMESYNPEYVLILSGDHIYKMDYEVMLDFHKENHADVTIATMPVPIEEASRFGIVIADENKKIQDFEEKPAEPRSNLASMGIYIFSWNVLKEALHAMKDQSGMHLEAACRLLLMNSILDEFRFSNCTLGKAVHRIDKKKMLDDNIIQALYDFVQIYNRSKHEVNQDETRERLFSTDDAIVVYFATRILGVNILQKLGRVESYKVYDIL